MYVFSVIELWHSKDGATKLNKASTRWSMLTQDGKAPLNASASAQQAYFSWFRKPIWHTTDTGLLTTGPIWIFHMPLVNCWKNGWKQLPNTFWLLPKSEWFLRELLDVLLSRWVPISVCIYIGSLELLNGKGSSATAPVIWLDRVDASTHTLRLCASGQTSPRASVKPLV